MKNNVFYKMALASISSLTNSQKIISISFYSSKVEDVAEMAELPT